MSEFVNKTKLAVVGTKAEATKTDLKLKRQHEIVRASEWGKITSKFRMAKPADRRRFAKEVRYELDVTDLRDEVVGIVHETFGRTQDAFHEVHALGGCHWRTLENWAKGEVTRPQLSKLRQVALTCGYDFTLGKITK